MEKMAALGEKADVVFMDPPRSGSTEQFMKSVVTLAPKKIVYISCDPQTQARDLKYLTRHGYKAMGLILMICSRSLSMRKISYFDEKLI